MIWRGVGGAHGSRSAAGGVTGSVRTSTEEPAHAVRDRAVKPIAVNLSDFPNSCRAALARTVQAIMEEMRDGKEKRNRPRYSGRRKEL